ncbi:MAG TPA: hypothetical protein PKA88_06100, partial [Polyangiaceae bacterium]|nr:hypothetical protein [Polyangiaceae bacterium]
DFSASAQSLPGRMHEDPSWRNARGKDALRVAELADREGASGLIEGVRLGGWIGLVGLQALPYAADAEVALGPLCMLAKEAGDSARAHILRALLSVAQRMRADVERVAAEDITSCLSTLASLSSAKHVPPSQRDLADAARVRLQQLPP